MRFIGSQDQGAAPVYRVRFDHPGGRVTYVGPWSELSTAKAQRTRELNYLERRLQQHVQAGGAPAPGPLTATIEQAGNWTEVPL